MRKFIIGLGVIILSIFACQDQHDTFKKGWSSAVLLENNSNDARSPQVVSDSSGNAIVIWCKLDALLQYSLKENHLIGAIL